MFRKDLITLLLDNPLRLSEIARLYDVPRKEVLDDIATTQDAQAVCLSARRHCSGMP